MEKMSEIARRAVEISGNISQYLGQQSSKRFRVLELGSLTLLVFEAQKTCVDLFSQHIVLRCSNVDFD